MRTVGPVLGSGGYAQPGATHFDGVADYYERTSPFLNAPTAANRFVACFFADPTAVTGAGNAVLATFVHNIDVNNTDPFFQAIFLSSGGLPYLVLQASVTTAGVVHNAAVISPLPPSFPDGNWHGFQCSMDTTSGAVQMFMDDSALATNGFGGPFLNILPFTLDLSAVEGWTVGSRWTVETLARSLYYDGCLAELFFTPVTTIPDFSIAANRRKFITADLKPVYLGQDGSLPFGTQPLFYSPQGNGTNLGYGGSLVPNGAPTVCGTHP